MTAPAPLADLVNNVNGLPTHALLVHFTVVIATAGAIGGLAYALILPFRRWLSWPLLAVGVASVVLGLVTPSSGEKLEARTEPSALLAKHTQLGDQMGIILIAYGAILILAMLVVRARRRASEVETADPQGTTRTALDRVGGLPGGSLRAFPGQRQLAALLTALVIAGAVVSGVWIYRTGEAGARSVWHDTPTSSAPARGGGDAS